MAGASYGAKDEWLSDDGDVLAVAAATTEQREEGEAMDLLCRLSKQSLTDDNRRPRPVLRRPSNSYAPLIGDAMTMPVLTMLKFIIQDLRTPTRLPQ